MEVQEEVRRLNRVTFNKLSTGALRRSVLWTCWEFYEIMMACWRHMFTVMFHLSDELYHLRYDMLKG